MFAPAVPADGVKICFEPAVKVLLAPNCAHEVFKKLVLTTGVQSIRLAPTLLVQACVMLELVIKLRVDWLPITLAPTSTVRFPPQAPPESIKLWLESVCTQFVGVNDPEADASVAVLPVIAVIELPLILNVFPDPAVS
jgi:hypothetical protein